jgi:menaquinone-9 beta-reductase
VVSCDALICGGGPAGSTLATRLVRQGLKVIVLDKAKFPRDKVCAGWVTPQVIAALGLDLADYGRTRTLQAIDRFATGLIGSRPIETAYRTPVSYGILRREFDDYLLRRSGATLRLGEPLDSLTSTPDGWLVNGAIEARLLVGAGGHFCPVAREIGAALGKSETVVAAQEVEFEIPADVECAVAPEAPELYFCPDLAGYAWAFRKGRYLNVGLGREDSHRLQEHVQAFCEFLRQSGKLPLHVPGRFKGHAYLLYPHATRPVVANSALLVGDAAGLAYAQSGEGIRPAVESAILAADAIVAAAGDYSRDRLQPYATALAARFGKRAERAPVSAPSRLRTAIGRWCLSNRWFARHVVLDRWFLHAQEPALGT